MTEIPKTTLIATLACLALATATGANGQGVAQDNA